MIGKLIVTVLLGIAALFSGSELILACLPHGEAALRARPGASGLLRHLQLRDPTAARVSLSRLRTELAIAPLEDYPLAMAGVVFLKSGDQAGAEAAARAVLRRNPRNLWGRTASVAETAVSGNAAGAVQQLSAVMILDPENTSRYIRAMALLVTDARAQAAMLLLLGSRPPWGDAFVREIVATRPDDSFAQQAARLTPSAQEAALKMAIARTGYERGYLNWISYFPDADIRLRWPYDGAFKGLLGAPPFNWKYDGENAELLPRGGLYVKSFGRRSEELASQIMLLGPGAYTLATDVAGEVRPRGAYFRWSLSCVEGAGDVLALDIDKLSDHFARSKSDFAIPETQCSTQMLSLNGVARELPLWAHATVARVSIERRGNAP